MAAEAINWFPFYKDNLPQCHQNTVVWVRLWRSLIRARLTRFSLLPTFQSVVWMRDICGWVVYRFWWHLNHWLKGLLCRVVWSTVFADTLAFDGLLMDPCNLWARPDGVLSFVLSLHPGLCVCMHSELLLRLCWYFAKRVSKHCYTSCISNHAPHDKYIRSSPSSWVIEHACAMAFFRYCVYFQRQCLDFSFWASWSMIAVSRTFWSLQTLFNYR